MIVCFVNILHGLTFRKKVSFVGNRPNNALLIYFLLVIFDKTQTQFLLHFEIISKCYRSDIK